MKRRSFLQFVGCFPFLGFLKKEPESQNRYLPIKDPDSLKRVCNIRDDSDWAKQQIEPLIHYIKAKDSVPNNSSNIFTDNWDNVTCDTCKRSRKLMDYEEKEGKYRR